MSLGALAIQFNRPHFPAWARTEMWTVWRSAGAMAPEVAAFVYPVERFSGSPMLIVGDSMATKWPWPADVLALPGASPRTLALAVHEHLAGSGRRYEQIVIWAGTAFVLGAADMDGTLGQLCELVAAAQPYGARVIVLGPMPAKALDVRAFLRRVEGGEGRVAGVDARIAQIPRLATLLQDRFPDVVVCDLVPFRDALDAGGYAKTALYDGVHLKPEGFTMLQPWLERCGLTLSAIDMESVARAHAWPDAAQMDARGLGNFPKDGEP